ncbi:hypothetical protein RCL1_001280 [Eukaryota sp. TZLM3-RCL]
MLLLLVWNVDSSFVGRTHQVESFLRVEEFAFSVLKQTQLPTFFTFSANTEIPYSQEFNSKYGDDRSKPLPPDWIKTLVPIIPATCVIESLTEVTCGKHTFKTLVYQHAEDTITPPFGASVPSKKSSIVGTELERVLTDLPFHESAVPPSLLMKCFGNLSTVSSMNHNDLPDEVREWLDSEDIEDSTKQLLDLYKLANCYWDVEKDYSIRINYWCQDTFPGIRWAHEGNYTDVSGVARQSHTGAPELCIETKTRSNSGDELGQILFAFSANVTKHVDSTSKCANPALLLTVRGFFISVYAAIVSGHSFRYELMFTMNLLLIGTDNPFMERNLVLLRAFRRTMKDLTSHYDEVGDSFTAEKQFPWITSINGSTIDYEKHLTRLVYLGKFKNEPVVIKFYRNYRVEIHKYLSTIGYAPEIKAFEKIGNWFVLIEEFLDGWTKVSEVLRASPADPDVSIIQEKAEVILEHLKKEQFVHGDFRPTNMFYNPTSKTLKVFDFEFSGLEGKDRYPFFINMDKTIPWAPSVGPNHFLQSAHDAHMLHHLKVHSLEVLASPSKNRPAYSRQWTIGKQKPTSRQKTRGGSSSAPRSKASRSE